MESGPGAANDEPAAEKDQEDGPDDVGVKLVEKLDVAQQEEDAEQDQDKRQEVLPPPHAHAVDSDRNGHRHRPDRERPRAPLGGALPPPPPRPPPHLRNLATKLSRRSGQDNPAC